MGNFMIPKMIAAGTRIRGCKGHYMGLKMGVSLEMGGYTGIELWGAAKPGECLLPEGTFSGTLHKLRELFFYF
jgi:hypothetical protein